MLNLEHVDMVRSRGVPISRSGCVKSVTGPGLALLVLLVAGCASTGDVGHTTSAPGGNARNAGSAPTEAALPRDSLPRAPLPRQKPPMPQTAATRSFPNPNTLVGLGPYETEMRIGSPQAVIQEPPATIWTYTSGPCVLNLFLYANVETRELRVLSYDVAARGVDDRALNDCFENSEMVRRGSR
ncbi:MAG: hypothetical protein WD270_00265 [Acetobacterales bacterium]